MAVVCWTLHSIHNNQGHRSKKTWKKGLSDLGRAGGELLVLGLWGKYGKRQLAESSDVLLRSTALYFEIVIWKETGKSLCFAIWVKLLLNSCTGFSICPVGRIRQKPWVTYSCNIFMVTCGSRLGRCKGTICLFRRQDVFCCSRGTTGIWTIWGSRVFLLKWHSEGCLHLRCFLFLLLFKTVVTKKRNTHLDG